MTGYSKPKAVVLSNGGVFYDNGRQHKLADRLDLDDLPRVLDGAHGLFRHGEGVMIVDTPGPANPIDAEQARDELVAAGWNCREVLPWTTLTRSDRTVVHLGFMPHVVNDASSLLKGAQGPADVAWRLGRYHTMVGVPWRYTAGVSGCAFLRRQYQDPRPGRQPLWHDEGPKGIRGAGPLVWSHPEQPAENADGIMAMFDVNAQYLASMKIARVAWGALQKTGPTGFDPAWPGWWEIDVTEIDPELYDGKVRPPVFPASRIHKGAAWLSTETVKYLSHIHGSLDVLDSYTSANGETIGRTFAERIGAARGGMLGPMGPTDLAIKRTYAETVGMVAREGGAIYRRDWAATWMDLARMNLLRRTDRAYAVGYTPMAVRTDAVWFHVPDKTAIERLTFLLGVGTGPGTFKNAQMFTVAEYHAKMRGEA